METRSIRAPSDHSHQDHLLIYDATGSPLRGQQVCRHCPEDAPHVHVWKFSCPVCSSTWADAQDVSDQSKPLRVPMHRVYSPVRFGAVCRGSGCVVAPRLVASKFTEKDDTL